MTRFSRNLYWDSCVFTSYFNNNPDRIQEIESVLAEVEENEDHRIITSSLSQVEVAYIADERLQNQPREEVVQRIDDFWANDSIVEVVEINPAITQMARKLMRDVLPNNWSLRPYDAVHLATASYLTENGLNVAEFQTYDERLFKFGPMIGIQIVAPHVLQQRMSLESPDEEE